MNISRIITLGHKIFCTINPKIEMIRWYKTAFGVKPSIEHPSNLLEKIYWMLLHTDTSLWTKCADKYLAREYITECGLGDYLPKLYGKWDNPEDISFDGLPDSFVLKANNGCGTVHIVKNKASEDIESIINMAKKWIAVPYGYAGGEIHYTKIKPCIIAEDLLDNDFEDSFSPHSMVDYKVWCINGEPECVLVTFDRYDNEHGVDLYDLDWKRCPEKMGEKRRKLLRDKQIPKPVCLSEMLSMARTLSATFPEVRVDFYVVHDKPVVGELTFTAGMGSLSPEYYEYLGSKIDLSKLIRIK